MKKNLFLTAVLCVLSFNLAAQPSGGSGPGDNFIAWVQECISNSTGISNIAAPVASKTTYDLSGRQVNNPTKGLYIQDGKKVVIK